MIVNLVFLFIIIFGSIISYFWFVNNFPAEQREFGFKEPVSPVMERITDFHDVLIWIYFGIPVFVVLLLVYASIRFHKKNNPIASNTTHNTWLEITWTAIPVLILIAIAIPSIKLLYYMDKAVDAEMTLKVVGYQWYWGYEYPDHDNISFESVMLQDDELKAGQKRLLETDNRVVLPVNTNIRVLITAADVIHSWAMPQFGVKTDAIPGRLNETWVNIQKEGVYYGQCSELCGANHGFMPIVVEAVSKEEFAKWIKKQQELASFSYKVKKLVTNYSY
jgi:cytochrome c oxidase subunit 2